MKKLFSFLFIILFPAYLFAQESKVHFEMLYPVVRVRANNVGGSGTVVYSQKDSTGSAMTFIVTNHHVIEGLIKIEEKWDPILKKRREQEVIKTAQVEFFKYSNFSHNIGTYGVEADVVAYSHCEGGQDWALLQLRDKDNIQPYVVYFHPRKEIEDIHIFDVSYAVGASLGHPPIVTVGNITYMDDEIDNFVYWMSSSQIIFGNSGGAIFRYSKERDKYEFIGIPSRISVIGGYYSSSPITHMGYFIPINRIYNLLDENCYQFIYDNNFTIEMCNAMRKEKKEKSQSGEKK